VASEHDGYDIEAIESALSADRFAPYVQSARGDRDLALTLYRLNTRVSASLYLPLQTLEVCLRNAFNDKLSAAYGEWWFERDTIVIDDRRRHDVTRAKDKLIDAGKRITPGRMIASLTLGFWTWCTTGPCQDIIWRRGGVSKAFPGARRFPTQGDINSMLTPLRHLRNRVAHHEPVLYLPLEKHHRFCITLTEWLSPEMARWAHTASTFDETYNFNLATMMLSPNKRQSD